MASWPTGAQSSSWMMLLRTARRLAASTVSSVGLASSLAACSSPVSDAHAETPTDPIDALPQGPLAVLRTTGNLGTSEGPETRYVVTFQDSTGVEHNLTVSFTSYPIVVTAVTIDGKNTARGASWARLGRRLVGALGQPNNVTILLRCFGGDTKDECFH
jgi:hypothetical protein